MIRIKEALFHQLKVPESLFRVEVQPVEEAIGENAMRRHLARKRKQEAIYEFAKGRSIGAVPEMVRAHHNLRVAQGLPVQRQEVVLFDRVRIPLPGQRVL